MKMEILNSYELGLGQSIKDITLISVIGITPLMGLPPTALAPHCDFLNYIDPKTPVPLDKMINLSLEI